MLPKNALRMRRLAYLGFGSVQRRTFLGLQRTPQPKPAMMAYLVAQGAGIVLLIDLGIATLLNDKTTFRTVCQAAGVWKDPPAFDEAHASGIEENQT